MNIVPIPSHQVDYAWADGAIALAESCEKECTIDQLKMLIARGERTLCAMVDDGITVGWGVCRVDQLPNIRALHITNLVGHNAHFESVFKELKLMAKSLGCSVVRCCAKPAQARLYRQKCGFVPVYETLEAEVDHGV
jgi:hypothetical protein